LDCVRAKLDEQPRLKQQAETRHAAFFAAQLRSLLAHSRGAYTPTVLDRLLEDAPNFVAALRYSTERAAYQSLIDLAPFLSWHFMLRGQMRDALDLTHELLQRLSAQDLPATGARLTLEVTRATLHMHIGNVSEADHVFGDIDQALFHHADDQLPLAFFEGWGLNDTRRGDYRLAHTRLERALDWARSHHHTAVLLRSLNHLAIAYAFDGAFSRAQKLLEEGHALYLRGHVPNSVDVIWLFTNTGMTQLLQCRYDEALKALETAEAVMRETKSDGFVPLVSMTTALALVERGLEAADHRALERAEALCRNGISKAVQVGELLAENLMHCVLGRILLVRAEIDAARHLLVKGLLSAWSTQDVTAFLWAMPYFLELCFATKKQTLGEAIAAQLLSHPLSGSWVRERVQRILTKYKVVEPASASNLSDSEALAWMVMQVRMNTVS
jgi:tetratricopeptide (TPR) repeat protein